FVFYFEKRVKRTIREYEMVKKGERIGVALSGGKDSLATLYLMNEVCKSMRAKLIAISVDEGIAGYRGALLKNARALCRKLKVKHEVFSFKKEIGKSMDEVAKIERRGGIGRSLKLRGAEPPAVRREAACTYCGVFRRWILNKAARELKLDKLATGHNLDDVAQTTLMNVMRNEPFRLARFGASGGIIESKEFVPRVKPLFRIPEKEVAQYAILTGLPVKFSECPYASEAFRGRVRKFVNEIEEEYPGTKFKIMRSFLVLKKGLASIYKKGELGELKKCERCFEPSSAKLCKCCELKEGMKKKN
ncbi:MAG: TIGR00269 family protein, partial [Candidatus Micrarchaeota archaeon]